MWGTKLIEREFPNPLTEVISTTDIMPEGVDEETERMREVMKKTFGVELNNGWPKFMSVNYHKL